ncbi:hypothetical protein T492DRAFT_939664 [Pavlovales sp. CCMP2436]|nr:hypothetical protein T492DRAFT_939664 [Pavlovales sp. CCMP2436]|mmetsp:Transcript_26660/g.67534  ORF Transcript_26660/g.67534 Transcript_26660/m.67534 type:complete len:324 (+) Transcript_26660:160-1131(+)
MASPSNPTDSELCAFVFAAVDVCTDLMEITARKIRHDAQARFGVDLRSRSQEISDWALDAAHAKQERVCTEDVLPGSAPSGDALQEEDGGAPAAMDLLGAEDALEEDASPEEEDDEEAEEKDEGEGGAVEDDEAPSAVEGLGAAVLALAAFLRALPTVVHASKDGEHEGADLSLDRAARHCRHAGDSLEKLVSPALVTALARLERHARELQGSLRACPKRPAHGTVRRGCAPPKLRRARPGSVRTRAVGVATRQLLKEYESEDPAAASERSSVELVALLYARMRTDFGGVLDILESTGLTEARVKTLIGLELEQSMKAPRSRV